MPVRHMVEEPPLLEKRDGMIYVDYLTADGTVVHLAMRSSTLLQATMEARQFLLRSGA